MATAAVIEAIKRYLGVSVSTDDTLIGELIDGVDSLVEDYVGWEIFEGSQSVTEYHDGRGEKRIVLKQWPVTSITSVHDDTDRDYESSDLVDSDDYTVELNSGIITLDGDGIRSGIFANGNQNVKVVYVAGYSILPNSVAQVRREETAIIYHRAKQGGDGIQSERQGTYSVTWRDEKLSKRSIMALNKYRTPVFVG